MNSLFRPPIGRHTFGVLDRVLFKKTVDLAAAAVADKKKIASWRQQMEKDKALLVVERLSAVVNHPNPALAEQGSRCILLDPKIRPEVRDTWTPSIHDGVSKREIDIIPYQLKLDYDFWTYEQVMRCLIPPELHDESDGFPVGFNQAGHVAHMNLRSRYLPYKGIIGEVLRDKNPQIRTVINKIAGVGAESEFRTFNYEVLAGEDDLKVEAHENGCAYSFDYAKVYWNSKLEREHRRMSQEVFKPGEVVCDVMAGIGPFAIPAAKRGIFVWANDYNPESYRYLEKNITRNKVDQWVRPFNEDGRIFIRKAVDLVYNASTKGENVAVPIKKPRKTEVQKGRGGGKAARATSPRRTHELVMVPPTISHFVMNLPATAYTFLPYYRGLYAGHENLFEPHTSTKLPMVHVYGFGDKEVGERPRREFCELISAQLGAPISFGTDPETPGCASVSVVRAVSPNQDMFCASFRIPREVAFAPRPTENS
ncbi:Met-10+ like-protein-domain-containing protein [Poronia punctata]|nr:Met-10+ like-protein-domain-containing protein [Poronia punctata]